MDERIPGEYSSDSGIRVGHRDDISDFERHPWVNPTRAFNKGWDLIDATGIDPFRREVRRPVTRPAASVEDDTIALLRPGGDEVHVRGMHRRHRTEQLAVLGCSTRVRANHVRHGSTLSGRPRELVRNAVVHWYKDGMMAV